MQKFKEMVQTNGLVSTITGFGVLFTILLANLSVFSRFANISLPAAEELLRYVFVWIIMFCTALLYADNGLISITMLEEKVEQKGHLKAAEILRIFNTVFVLFFAGICVFYSAKIAWFQFNSSKQTPVMEIPMFLVTIGMTLGSILWVFISVTRVIGLVKHKK